eukprot:9556069-Lingulodinium_polyedra.AAC.1
MLARARAPGGGPPTPIQTQGETKGHKPPHRLVENVLRPAGPLRPNARREPNCNTRRQVRRPPYARERA